MVPHWIVPLEGPPAAVGKSEEVEMLRGVVLGDVSAAYGLGDGHDLSGLDVFWVDAFARVLDAFARENGGVMKTLFESH